MRVLIVDDEALARERVRTLLAHEGDVEVVGEAADGVEAVEAVVRERPDVVFLDVQMPEMDGFQVLEALDALDAVEAGEMPEVVFVTAYDQYALKAFDVHALDYLLKPFDRERFRGTVARARARLADSGETGDVGRRLVGLLEELRSRARDRPVRRFVVKSRGRVRFVMAEDVEWIEAAGNYVTLHLADGSHMIRGTMKRLEDALDPATFVRVHRSAIVNLDRVREVQPWFSGDYVILTESGREITSGETYRGRMQALLKNPL